MSPLALLSIGAELLASSPRLRQGATFAAYGIAGCILLGVVWYSGRQSCRLEAKMAGLKTQLAQKAHDLKVQASVSAWMKDRKDAAEQANAELQGKVDEYADALKKRPAAANSCALTDDDVRRLRSIR
ncbi:hypothetical protein J6524_04740 [Bradyrhizobium sp. WSM 1738]|uniref:hypothetical protein n=1 Tax=Bradyrhizobium hereditatis TaxID=2821405 RepID=UPI001CE25E88|nr:hypothetical protein [Bradyrhizobium hereditatis]MCA6114236.1 hypothetical protein [Bradyrhizobium hereditatis]